MNSRVKHHRLIAQGARLHEARRYTSALTYFERALRVAPKCSLALYNRANTLHMLGRDEEAYPILRALVQAGDKDLLQGCPNIRPRSLRLDAFQLLFWVVLYGRGYCAEAFRYAAEHARRRTRGLRSAWTAREVRADVARMRRNWKELQAGGPGQLVVGVAQRQEVVVA